MQTQVETRARIAPAAAPRRQQSLDGLALLDSPALEALFASAHPFPAEGLQGHPRGRVLAIPGGDRGLAASVLRVLHKSPLWPWEGKSFRGGAEGQGAGINRVSMPLRIGLFPFRTYATASVVDGKPCFAIDYDVPENPRVARAIYDEVRKVDEGLYLGRGMRRRPGREPRLVLWFALDATIDDPAVTIPTR
jgi:hypothetical protein